MTASALEAPVDVPCLEPCHIVKTPGVMSGRARIKGTRIRVMDLVELRETNGFSADEVGEQFPGVPLAAIYAAFAYYFDHVDEIRGDIASSDEAIAQFRSDHPELVHPASR